MKRKRPTSISRALKQARNDFYGAKRVATPRAVYGPRCTCAPVKQRLPHNAACPRSDDDRAWSIRDRADCTREARRHAGLGLPCDVCPGPCEIDTKTTAGSDS